MNKSNALRIKKEKRKKSVICGSHRAVKRAHIFNNVFMASETRPGASRLDKQPVVLTP